MFVASGRKTHDWSAIRAYYDTGRTATEAQRAFEISNGAWYRAVQRGAIVLRAVNADKPRGQTRAAVAELLAQGLSQAAIALRLGVSKPTVCFHVRKLGIVARPDAAKRYKWDEIRAYRPDRLTDPRTPRAAS